MSAAVLCAVRGPGESAVVRALGEQRGLEVSRRCADLAELLAAAAAGLGSVAVVSTDLPGLDREAVRHLHGSGVWVVALADDRAGWTPDRVARLDVDAVVADESPAAVVDAVAGAVERATRGSTPGVRPDVPAPESAPEPEPAAAGRLVTVWGPTGAPGRTTVALGVAAELAEEGALLIDADPYGGTVAPAIGLLDEAPGIAAACRAAATGRLDPATLAATTPRLDGGLRVLTGISRADRWPELAPSALEDVWATARALTAWTVVDTGFGLEEDEALSYDTRAPQRNGATLSALRAADLVLVVGGGDPIGLQRLVRGLADLDKAGVTAPRRVVVNRVRAATAGPRPGEAIREALARYAGVGQAHLVPDDPAACDSALLAGRLVAEHVPGAPVHRALAQLAGVVRAALPAAAASTAH